MVVKGCCLGCLCYGRHNLPDCTRYGIGQTCIQLFDAFEWISRRFSRSFGRKASGDEEFGVLEGADNMVLDALLVQASPAGAFEVMQVGALSKAAFHQVASADAVLPSFLASALLYGFVDEVLCQMSLERPAGLGLGAAFPQVATGAYVC